MKAPSCGPHCPARGGSGHARAWLMKMLGRTGVQVQEARNGALRIPSLPPVRWLAKAWATIRATPSPHRPTVSLTLAHASCPHHTSPARQHHSYSPAIKTRPRCCVASPIQCAYSFMRATIPRVPPPTFAPRTPPASQTPVPLRPPLHTYIHAHLGTYESLSSYLICSKYKQDEEGAHRHLPEAMPCL